jgi:hypothetical protein
MIHKETCDHCVDNEGKPQIQCSVRAICYDDASTTERRKQILEKLPEYTVE